MNNAVLILHGTGGPAGIPAAEIRRRAFGPGSCSTPRATYIILPDTIGHGKSSKPSDGQHTNFPQYDYDDMVRRRRAALKGRASTICG